MRTVLNYKGIPYKQSWISYPDIAPISKSLEIPAQTGSSIQYTLPAIIHKPSITANPHGAMYDSFPIALHLDKTFSAPQYPSIFPNGQASITLAVAVEEMFMPFLRKTATILFPGIQDILDDRGAKYFEATRVPNFQRKHPHIKTLADMKPKSEKEMDEMAAEAKKELQVYDELLAGAGENKGPFFEGDKPSFADMMLAVHLAWVERAAPEFFAKILDAGNGSIRKHWEASQSFLEGQGETVEWDVPNEKTHL